MTLFAPGIRVLAERITFNSGVDSTPSGLLVYRDEKEHFDDVMQLVVHAVGPDVREDIKPGDVVLTRGMAGADVHYDGFSYISLHEADVLAVIEGDTD